MIFRLRPITCFLLLVVGCFTSTVHSTQRARPRPRIDYLIHYDPKAAPARFFISMNVTGIPSSDRPLTYQLRDWGEWTTRTELPYLTNLKIEGQQQPGRGDQPSRVPAKFLSDGKFVATYEIGLATFGSEIHKRHPLLGYKTDDYAFAFLRNTLLELRREQSELEADVSITITTDGSGSVYAGWSGVTESGKTITLPRRFQNGLFAVGRSVATAEGETKDTKIEVVQFATGPDMTKAIANIATTLLPAYARTTGIPAPKNVRVIVDQSPTEEVSVGTWTDAGLIMSLHLSETLADPVTELLAHEFFHAWLGTGIVEDGSVIWFSEGFTDYMALWHAAATELITPARFQERILEIARIASVNARDNRPTFADTSVKWRDKSSGNEILSYRGGALVALATDVQLRKQNSSLAQLIKRLFERPERKYGIADIEKAMSTSGVSSIYSESVKGRQLPNARALLVSVGFDELAEPASLTYLGIEARPIGSAVVPAEVVEVDPSGPGAKAGIQVGDRIVAFGPSRNNPPGLTAQSPQRYRFGLEIIPSGAKTAPLELIRNGQRMKVDVAPRLVNGGERKVLRWNPTRATQFFTLPE